MRANTWYAIARTSDKECTARVSFSIDDSVVLFDVFIQYGNISIAIVSATVQPSTTFFFRVRSQGGFFYVDVKSNVEITSTPNVSITQVLNTLVALEFSPSGDGTQECIISTEAYAPRPSKTYVTLEDIQVIQALKYFADGLAIGTLSNHHTLIYGADGIYLDGKKITTADELTQFINDGDYNSTSKKIELKHGSTVIAEIDATAFIKDGMVSNVEVKDVLIDGQLTKCLIITFNTDAGKEPITIPLNDIFDASLYYTKTEVNTLLEGYVTIAGYQQITGEKWFSNALAIPTSAPSSPTSGRPYIYADPNGNYSQQPGGGGGYGELLTLSVNGSSFLQYDGTEAVTKNLQIPTTVASLSDAGDYATKVWVQNQGYLTSASLSGYVNAISTTGDGNAVTAVSKDSGTLTFTKGNTFVDIASAQTITGAKKHKSVALLNLPTSAPASGDIENNKAYIYDDTTGNYSQEPEGSVAQVFDLYLYRGALRVGPYNLSEEDAEINLATFFSGYATESWVSGQGFATQTWVTSQGYITSASLSSYVNSVTEDGNGNAYTSLTKSGNSLTLHKGNTFVDLTSAQKITGAKKHQNVAVLNLPTSDPGADAENNKVYLYDDTTGNYSQTPGGGIGTVYPLTLTVNGTSTVYEPDVEAKSVSITIPTPITAARNLSDADDLLFKDSSDTGTDVTIDVETGVTGTVLWGAESANQVALSVNGESKLLLKAAALNGINSSITTILGYFSGGSAYNALALEGHNASYFAAASSVPTNVSQLTNDSGYITNSTSNLANYYLKTETYTKTEVENLISSGAYTLPTASSTTKGGIKVGNTLSISNEVLNVLAGNIASNNTGYVTGGDIYSYINAIMSSSMKNIGVSSTAITNGGSETPTINGSPYTPNVNDVVFYDSKEFVWTASGTWRELGDESSFALKTTSISAGTGLTGGGTLSENRTISLSSATITSLGKADTALQSADMKALTLVVGSITIGNDYNALAAKTYTISKSNLTTTLESDSGYYVKKAGDTMTGTLNSQSVIPTTTNTYSLGSSSLKYLDAYATTFYGALSGNASTATKLATARTLWGQSFDGSANVSGSLTDVTDITATGFAQLPSIYAATSLAIPTSAPSSSASWYSSSRYYLYADANGNYSETPSGGGGGVGETLTLRVNGSKLFDYNGSEAVSENITVPTTLADLSSDSTHRTVSDTQIGNWNTAYGWGNHANAGYLTSVAFSDLTSHPTTLSGYGITDAKIETPSGTSNKKITLGSDELLLYAWALASAKPTYDKADVGLGNVENTALSTWAGTTNITTLGTVTTGTWNGTAIANDKLALDMSWEFVSNTASYDTTDLIVIN